MRSCAVFFQAEDGIRDAQESRGLGDVYKRQARVENEKTKGRRDGMGRRIGDERWVTVDAGFNTPVSYTHLTLPTIYSV